MTTKKHIIWSSDINVDDWHDYLAECREEDPDLTDDEIYARIVEQNDDYLEDEVTNLKLGLDLFIIVIADLGLWDGRHCGYKTLPHGDICDCLQSECRDNSSIEWYVDAHDNLRCREAHHDGVNYYLYRAYKPGLSFRQKCNFERKILNGTATQKDITRYTRRLGDYVNAVYGW
jgi:hypothetical protein